MFKLVIDDMDVPEKFTTPQEVKSYAHEFFGSILEWNKIDGYETAKFEDEITIQIKPVN